MRLSDGRLPPAGGGGGGGSGGATSTGTAAGLSTAVRRGPVRVGRRTGGQQGRRGAADAARRTGHRERHALPVLARVDRHHMVDRHDDFARAAAEAGLEFDLLVAEFQAAGGLEADVEHDLVVLDVLLRYLHLGIDEDRDVGREAIVGAPIVQGTDQVGPRRTALTVRRHWSRCHVTEPTKQMPRNRPCVVAISPKQPSGRHGIGVARLPWHPSNQADAAEPALPGRWRRPPGGERRSRFGGGPSTCASPFPTASVPRCRPGARRCARRTSAAAARSSTGRCRSSPGATAAGQSPRRASRSRRRA